MSSQESKSVQRCDGRDSEVEEVLTGDKLFVGTERTLSPVFLTKFGLLCMGGLPGTFLKYEFRTNRWEISELWGRISPPSQYCWQGHKNKSLLLPHKQWFKWVTMFGIGTLFGFRSLAVWIIFWQTVS